MLILYFILFFIDWDGSIICNYFTSETAIMQNGRKQPEIVVVKEKEKNIFQTFLRPCFTLLKNSLDPIIFEF